MTTRTPGSRIAQTYAVFCTEIRRHVYNYSKVSGVNIVIIIMVQNVIILSDTRALRTCRHVLVQTRHQFERSSSPVGLSRIVCRRLESMDIAIGGVCIPKQFSRLVFCFIMHILFALEYEKDEINVPMALSVFRDGKIGVSLKLICLIGL